MRDVKKEIGPCFRFRPNNDSERVADTIKTSGISQLISEHTFYDNSKAIQSTTIHKARKSFDSSLTRKLIYGSTTPLHNKIERMHFKAATSVYLKDVSKFYIIIKLCINLLRENLYEIINL